MRALARLCLKKTFACAAELGAPTVVFHAGYVNAQSYWNHFLHGPRRLIEPTAADRRRRRRRGRQMMATLAREFEQLVPFLEKDGLVLALENLPRFEGFPSTEEAEQLMADLAGAPIALWFDTGHARVCEMHGWLSEPSDPAAEASKLKHQTSNFVGRHLNDVEAFDDDHFAPGRGNVDFAALKTFAEGVRHVVFEPNSGVTEAELKDGVEHIRKIWNA